MTWNYRIVKRPLMALKVPGKRPEQRFCFELREVYYHKTRAGKWRADTWTVEPCTIVGETRADIVETLKMMLKDARKRAPILDAANPPWKKNKPTPRKKSSSHTR